MVPRAMNSATLDQLGFSHWIPFGPSTYPDLTRAVPVLMGIYAIRYAPCPPGLKSDILYIGSACSGYGLMDKIRQHLHSGADDRSSRLLEAARAFSTEVAYLTTADALEANTLYRQLLDDFSRQSSLPPLNVGEEVETIDDYINEGARFEEEEVMEAFDVINHEEAEALRFAEEEQETWKDLEKREYDYSVDAPEGDD